MYEVRKEEMNRIQKVIYNIFKKPIDRRISIENSKIIARKQERIDSMFSLTKKDTK